MPRTNLVTRVQITGYTYVTSGLNLIATQAHPSPYNPPIKYLTSELPSLGKVPQDSQQTIVLVNAHRETRDITTFTFELQDGAAVDIIPGQHAILDFSAEKTQGYRHMADEAPQSLNDDYVRSWTISSIPEVNAQGEYLPSTRFSCTIKNKYGGAVTPLLHRWARHRRQSELSIKFIGVEGAFTCFDENNRLKEEKMLFIAGGVGITPFMAMLGVLTKRTVNADVVLLFSARGEEVGLAARFTDAGIDTRIFDTDPEGEAVNVTRRRIKYEDVASVPGLTERGVYLCGPDGFMQVVRGYLEKAGVDAGKVNVESFAF
jgi:uncharacterized protein